MNYYTGDIVKWTANGDVGVIEDKTDDGWLYIRGDNFDHMTPVAPRGFEVTGKAKFNPEHKGSSEYDDSVPLYLM